MRSLSRRNNKYTHTWIFLLCYSDLYISKICKLFSHAEARRKPQWWSEIKLWANETKRKIFKSCSRADPEINNVTVVLTPSCVITTLATVWAVRLTHVLYPSRNKSKVMCTVFKPRLYQTPHVCLFKHANTSILAACWWMTVLRSVLYDFPFVNEAEWVLARARVQLQTGKLTHSWWTGWGLIQFYRLSVAFQHICMQRNTDHRHPEVSLSIKKEACVYFRGDAVG